MLILFIVDTMAEKNMPRTMTALKRDCGNVFQDPLRLIDSDAHTGKIQINWDVLEQIEAIKKQLNVISIAGRYRSGKSYLMNRLAGKKKGRIINTYAFSRKIILLLQICFSTWYIGSEWDPNVAKVSLPMWVQHESTLPILDPDKIPLGAYVGLMCFACWKGLFT